MFKPEGYYSRAVSSGVRGFAVDYCLLKLARTDRWPVTSMDDVQRAVRWVRANAVEVWGESGQSAPSGIRLGRNWRRCWG